MELTGVNNSYASSTNDLGILRPDSTKSIGKNDTPKFLNVDKIEPISTRQSAFATGLQHRVSTLSNLESLKNNIAIQTKIVSNFEKMVASALNNGNNIDHIQPEVQSHISSFNAVSNSSIENINKIIEEKESDKSRTYFDGILGAKPLSAKEIQEAINQKKERLAQLNEVINDQIIQTTNDAKQSIEQEKSVFEQKSSFVVKTDFQLESKTFEMENLQEQSGSVVTSQANAQVKETVPLLLA